MTINWNSLYVNQLKNKTVYEVDLTSSNDSYITNGFLSNSEKDNYIRRSRFKLLLFEDIKTGKITEGYYMVTLSDKPAHYTATNDFTGYIYFYNQIGNFVNGWSFEAGKAVQSISQSTEEEYKQSVNFMFNEQVRLADFGGGRLQFAAQQFCYTITIPQYATFCTSVGDSPPVCFTQIIGYNYGRFCVQVEIPTDGNGGVLPDPANPTGLVPLKPTLPTIVDEPTPKNYGVDPNCLNCQVPINDFDKLKADAEAAGLVVYVPVSNVTVTLPDGSTAIGTITEIRTTSGALVVAYFKPNVTSGPFTLGYQYSLGNKGPNGAENANTPSPVFFSPAGLPINFGTLPSFGGGGSGGGAPTYSGDSNNNPNPVSQFYTELEVESVVNSIKDPITGSGIELYLIVQFQGSKLIDLSNYSTSATIEVRDYTLRPHYTKSGKLLFYAAARLAGGGTKHGIELIIRADQLNAFKTNVEYYTKVADWFYMNGTPSDAMIKYVAGSTITDRVSALTSLWGDALKSPEYWAYLISCFVIEPSNPNLKAVVEESVPLGASYTRSTLEIGQRMHAEYKISDVIPNVAIKVFRDIKGIRPDFVDFRTKTIFELKPNNLRQITAGKAQLANYKTIFETQYSGTTWQTILDTY